MESALWCGEGEISREIEAREGGSPRAGGGSRTGEWMRGAIMAPDSHGVGVSICVREGAGTAGIEGFHARPT
jgi:hypothetical protein